MSNPIPSALALNVITNGTTADATPVESNFANIQTAVNGLVVALDGGVLGQFLQAIDGTDVQWAKTPATEIGYDQITTNVGIAGTTSLAPTSVIAGSAYTFDGSLVLAEFFSPLLSTPAVASGNLIIGLYEGSTLIAQLSQITTPAAVSMQAAGYGALRFTPAAGSHTYSIKAWCSSTTGGPTVVAGTGTAGAYAPSFLRLTKV